MGAAAAGNGVTDNPVGIDHYDVVDGQKRLAALFADFVQDTWRFRPFELDTLGREANESLQYLMCSTGSAVSNTLVDLLGALRPEAGYCPDRIRLTRRTRAERNSDHGAGDHPRALLAEHRNNGQLHVMAIAAVLPRERRCCRDKGAFDVIVIPHLQVEKGHVVRDGQHSGGSGFVRSVKQVLAKCLTNFDEIEFLRPLDAGTDGGVISDLCEISAAGGVRMLSEIVKSRRKVRAFRRGALMRREQNGVKGARSGCKWLM
jgi:hypothetical protein